MNNHDQPRKNGICALTGDAGRFIKCHIIPEAVTETVWNGQPLSQKGKHGKIIRRWTSWYDPVLVTRAGEDILQKYDDQGIRICKKNKLIWQSWGPMQILSTADHLLIPPGDRGLRTLDLDTKGMRLFLLSILWRAAATSLWEFENVRLDEADFERLTKMVRDGDAHPYDFIPISLIQLSTRAALPINHSIFKATKRIPSIENGAVDFEKGYDVDFFRAYFDGLIVNYDLNNRIKVDDGKKSAFICEGCSLGVPTVPADASTYLNNVYYEIGAPVGQEYLTERLAHELGHNIKATGIRVPRDRV